jgi:hypothetical protein
MSREDRFKIWAGPIVKKIEDVVYADPHFVKHCPVHLRPAYVSEQLGAVPDAPQNYVATDYTAYESHYTSDVMRAIDHELFKFFLKKYYPMEYHILTSTFEGINELYFPKMGVKATCRARRMSGEMNTALNNGFGNAMVYEYLAYLRGVSVKYVVEGDDGVGVFSDGWVPTSEDFKRLGFTVKVETSHSCANIGFCGFVADERDLQNVRDPVEKLIDFGWTRSERFMKAGPKKIRGLIKAKAMSMIAELPSCPIVTAFAVRMRDLCGDEEPLFTQEDWWLRENLDYSVQPQPIGLGTRTLVANKYGISIPDQLRLEGEIGSWSLGPIRSAFLQDLCWRRFPDACLYYQRYVHYGGL